MFSRFVIRNALWIVLMGMILSILGGYYSAKLYRNLRADLSELLPTDTRSVKDLNEVTSRLRSVDNLALLIVSEDPIASKRFVDDLAESLKSAPKDLVAGVEYRLDRELEFFRKRQALYLGLDDLRSVRDQLEARIEYETEIRNPLNIFAETDIPEPKFEVERILSKYQGRLSTYNRFPGGYYASPDEKKRVMLIAVGGDASNFATAQRLRHEVKTRIEQLAPRGYAPDLQVWYSGNVQNVIEEQEALLADVALSTLIVTLVVSVALWVFFRSVMATLLLLTSLMMGTLITFGVCYFAVGFLNANSAFLGSIVIGNGINFGIIYMARYLEERRAHRTHLHATEIALQTTAAATWTAALAAGAAYGSLMLTGFRGFKQFGLIGFIGMLICWVSAFTFLPALLALAKKTRTFQGMHLARPHRHRLFVGLQHFISRFPRAIVAAAAVATVASAFALTKLDSSVLEADLSRLRSKRSLEQGSAFHAISVNEVLQRYLTPVVVLAPSREDAAKMASELKNAQKKNDLIVSVQTLDDFLPKQQTQKIEVLREIKSLLTPRVVRSLEPKFQALVDDFISEEAFRPLQIKDLPTLLRGKFTEKDGSLGRMVLIEPPTDARIRERENLFGFVATVRRVSDSVSPDAPVAGTLPITSDLLSSISSDGPKATLFAFLAVSLVVALVFRHLSTTLLSLSALLLGVLWLAGAIVGLDFKINFLNFVALPITFGIGVDYGVNVFQRYRLEGRRNILGVLKETGSAVGLCSFTTIVGYGSLLLAQNQAFVSFGKLAIFGELTCLLAAVVAMPAFMLLRERKMAAQPPEAEIEPDHQKAA